MMLQDYVQILTEQIFDIRFRSRHVTFKVMVSTTDKVSYEAY